MSAKKGSQPVCSMPDCGRTFYGRGRCKNHYMQWYRSVGSSVTRPSVSETFWSHVTKTDGCWLWTGPANALGYGDYKVGGKHNKAHRWSYAELVGEVPPGLELDHLCRVPACVNPAHLEPVTKAENLRRVALARTACKWGHSFDVENTYYRPDTGTRQCRACARERKLAA